MTPTIKYTYFDLAGGNEAPRLALLIGGIPFEDDRIALSQWPERKPKTPLGSLPVATIDGKEIVQGKAILRYFGRLTGLYPEDAHQAMLVDQVIDTTTDFHHTWFEYTGTDKDLLRESRDKAMTEGAKRYWGGCEKMLADISSGPFVLGDKVSIADLSIANIYLILKIGFLEYLPQDGLREYPRMYQVFKSVCEIPQVREWHKKHGLTDM